MTTLHTCPGEHCSSVGVDAVPLETFAAITTVDGETILYDREHETGWIQSDLYVPRELMA